MIKKVKIGSMEYKIIPVNTINAGQDDGEFDASQCKILIDKEVMDIPQRLYQVILHEVFHAMTHAYNIDLGDDEDEENRVESLSLATYDFIKNNKTFIRSILKDG